MSYHSRLHGEWTITPPLQWATLRTSEFVEKDRRSYRKSIKYRIETFVEDADRGP